jgi:hypothetical protein
MLEGWWQLSDGVLADIHIAVLLKQLFLRFNN